MDISQRTVEGMKELKSACASIKSEISNTCAEASQAASLVSGISTFDIMQCEAGDNFVRLKRNIDALNYLLSQACDIANSIHTASAIILYKLDEHGEKEKAIIKANTNSIKNSKRQAIYYQQRKACKTNV